MMTDFAAGIAGKTVLEHTVTIFQKHSAIDEIAIVVRQRKEMRSFSCSCSPDFSFGSFFVTNACFFFRYFFAKKPALPEAMRSFAGHSHNRQKNGGMHRFPP